MINRSHVARKSHSISQIGYRKLVLSRGSCRSRINPEQARSTSTQRFDNKKLESQLQKQLASCPKVATHTQGRYRHSDSDHKDSKAAQNLNTHLQKIQANRSVQQKLNPSQLIDRTHRQKDTMGAKQIVRRLAQLDSATDQIIKSKLVSMAYDHKQINNKKRRSITSIYDMKRTADQQNYQKQLSSVITELNTLEHSEKRLTPNSKKNIRFSDRKIALMEKILAEMSMEREIMAKQYASKNHKSKCELLLPLKDGAKYKIESPKYQLPKTTTLKGPTHPNFFNSESRTKFQAPKQEDYKIYRYQQPAAKIDPQPLPRSSYNSEYLRMGGSQQVGPLRTESQSHVLPFQTKSFGNSSYARQYKPVKATNTDYRTLDSYRNKLKDLQICFTRNQKEQKTRTVDELMLYAKEKQSLKTEQKSVKSDLPGIRANQLVTITESRRQYMGQFEKPSEIKHKRLANLKYSYKKFLHT